jgi:hypothetical protein
MAWYGKKDDVELWTQEEADEFVSKNRAFLLECGYLDANVTLAGTFIDVGLRASPNCNCSSFEAIEDYFGGKRIGAMFLTASDSGKTVRFRIVG